MIKSIYKTVLIAGGISLFISCEKDDVAETIKPVDTSLKGAYVINQGEWGANNGSLQFLDLINNSISDDIYFAQNDKAMGDIFEDVCVYGSKVYCTITESSKVLILERSGKEIKEISLKGTNNEPFKPRYLKSHKGNVYISAYNGQVHKLDTLSLNITGAVDAGAFPEAMSIVNDKLFVNNSDWNYDETGKTVTVIDLNEYKKISTIDVPLNPYNQSITINGNVYIVCSRRFGENGLTSILVKIDPTTYETEEICTASYIAAGSNNEIFIAYNDYYVTNSLSYKIYDVEKKKITNESFIGNDIIANPNTINIDKNTGDIFITNSVYNAHCELYVFDKDFKLKNKYNTEYNTSKVEFAY